MSGSCADFFTAMIFSEHCSISSCYYIIFFKLKTKKVAQIWEHS
ncbi:Uncharacterized protein dnm_055190 [Desulfonema magnum]|uniref:Uncharacterized protein n=1 Tax=Desulfonema magnum TaxID=45655 RepID=A0A975BQD8_9BACT|nr:Uncharacterized protein dnm_055190 [Desulfonema magnum]